MESWDDELEGKCQALKLQLLMSVLFRSSKSLSRTKNILCFQITLLLLGSQHNSFVFYPKSVGIRDCMEALASLYSAHTRQQTLGGCSELPSTPSHGKPQGCFLRHRVPAKMQGSMRLTFITCWARMGWLAISWPRSTVAICSQYCRAWAGSP